MLRKAVGTAARDVGQRKMVLAIKYYGLWRGLLLLCSIVCNRQKEAPALWGADGRVLYSSGQSQKTLMYILWSPWGLTGAHSPTKPGMQGWEDTGDAWGSFKLEVPLPNLGEPCAASHQRWDRGCPLWPCPQGQRWCRTPGWRFLSGKTLI